MVLDKERTIVVGIIIDHKGRVWVEVTSSTTTIPYSSISRISSGGMVQTPRGSRFAQASLREGLCSTISTHGIHGIQY